MARMTRNEQIIEAFVRQTVEKAEVNNLTIRDNGDSLVNYRTTIAQYVDGYLIINSTKYSVTTSKIQGKLRTEARCYLPASRILETDEHVPEGTANLFHFCSKMKELV